MLPMFSESLHACDKVDYLMGDNEEIRTDRLLISHYLGRTISTNNCIIYRTRSISGRQMPAVTLFASTR